MVGEQQYGLVPFGSVVLSQAGKNGKNRMRFSTGYGGGCIFQASGGGTTQFLLNERQIAGVN